jgi:hypothetical protein
MLLPYVAINIRLLRVHVRLGSTVMLTLNIILVSMAWGSSRGSNWCGCYECRTPNLLELIRSAQSSEIVTITIEPTFASSVSSGRQCSGDSHWDYASRQGRRSYPRWLVVAVAAIAQCPYMCFVGGNELLIGLGP